MPYGGGGEELDAVAKKTLSEVQFAVGDWIDVAVYPEGHGGVSSSRGFVGGRGGVLGGPRENGFGGFKVRGFSRAGGFADRVGSGGVPSGEWRRGEKVEDNFERERNPGMGRGGSGGGGGGGGGFRRGGGGRRYRD